MTSNLHCEICDAEVNDSGAHYVATRKDPHRDGYWKCHADVGKWRCAKCDRRWKPKKLTKNALPACPSCREDLDVFPADDGGWERAEAERQAAKYRNKWNHDV